MSCKTEDKQIGDHTFMVTQWPADQALLNKFKLIKLFGPALTTLAPIMSTQKGKGGLSEGGEISAFSDALSKLFECNTPEELVTFMKNCIVGAMCDGERITESKFTEIFSGDDLIEVYKVFLFVLKVNYSNLFKGQLAEKLLASIKEKL